MKLLTLRGRNGFTLLELLTVMAIIVTLAGIILAGVGFAQQKAARERATAEIAGLSTALESYKIDNGDYPKKSVGTDPSTDVAVAAPSKEVSTLLYRELGKGGSDGKGARYFEFKGDMLDTGKIDTGVYIVDPFGNPYGYSTLGTNNPTFDLWSTAGTTGTGAADKAKWITNW